MPGGLGSAVECGGDGGVRGQWGEPSRSTDTGQHARGQRPILRPLVDSRGAGGGSGRRRASTHARGMQPPAQSNLCVLCSESLCSMFHHTTYALVGFGYVSKPPHTRLSTPAIEVPI